MTKESEKEIKTGKITQSFTSSVCIECGKEIEKGILCEGCNEED